MGNYPNTDTSLKAVMTDIREFNNNGGQDGSGRNVIYLDRQNVEVSPDSVLKSFQLTHLPNMQYYYRIQEGKLKVGDFYASRIAGSQQVAYTESGDGADQIALIYLDKHKVMVPQHCFLTKFVLRNMGGNKMRYEYSYAQFTAGGLSVRYDTESVLQGHTPEDIGAGKSLDWLDRHLVQAPDGCILLGFKVQGTGGDKFYVLYWYVPADKIYR